MDYNDEECPICFENNNLVNIIPCSHKFCNKCAIHSSIQFGMKCSICRSIVCGIEPSEYRQDCVIDVGNGLHAGVTLRNDSKGVRVTKLEKRNQGIKVLKINDVITSLNGIPAIHHRDVVTGIDEATKSGYPVQLTLYKKGDPINDVKKIQEIAKQHHDSHDDWVRSHTRV